MYLAKGTRPDIMLNVVELATKSNNPTVKDEKRVDRVLMFVNFTREKEIFTWVKDLTLYGYIDASYAVHSDGKCHTGMIIQLGIMNGATI